MKFKTVILAIVFLMLLYGYGISQNNTTLSNLKGKKNYGMLAKDALGTYSSPPLLPNGRVDMHRLISELKDIHANTYDWLMGRGRKNNFNELKEFLPLASKAGLKVWVTLVPPSEPPAPNPFGWDYNKWAEKLATLSKEYPNLVAWSIDDFTHNLRFFTPEKVKEFVSKSRKINPKFAFIPTCYYRGVNKSFVTGYSNWIGGILFPYRAASSDKMNLKDPSLVEKEVAHFHALFGPNIPIIVDVYASAHSTLGSTTPEYVRTVVSSCLKYADGVMIYTNQDPEKNAKKYDIIKEEFNKGFQRTTEDVPYKSLEKGVKGTYASPPLLPNGNVDMHRLIAELKDIHANTYNWLIWRKNSGDFDELKQFLPLARKAGIKVWVTLVPPSEAPPPKPFGLDYDQWATNLAELSKKEPNLVAWSIDDFTSNIILKHFTPEYVEGFLSKAHAINPKLQFVPCCYYKATISENFVKNYAHLLGGILFPYRAGSDGDNVTDPTLVASEVTKLRNKLGSEIPIIVDVYVTTLYRHKNTTPEYVQKVVAAALKHADGVMIYTNQDPVKNKEKYKIIKRLFGTVKKKG